MDLLEIESEQKAAIKVVYCQMCKNVEKQYKCPQCDMFTCSLTCCKDHKEQFGCTGKRNRTSYVSSSDFKEQNLRSDYHFLEDVLQSKDNAKRTLLQDCGGPVKENNNKKARTKNSVIKEPLPGIMQQSAQNLEGYSNGVRNLVIAAKERGVHMVLMPNGMTKRLNNKTTVGKQRKIIWKVQLVFILDAQFDRNSMLKPDSGAISGQFLPLSDSVVSLTLDQTDEAHTMSDLLNLCLEPKDGSTVDRHTLKALRSRAAEIECFLQRIPSPANNPLFTKISLDSTLKEALNGQTVVEYPTFFFGVASHLSPLRTLVSEMDVLPLVVKKSETRKKTQKKRKARVTDNKSPLGTATGSIQPTFKTVSPSSYSISAITTSAVVPLSSSGHSSGISVLSNLAAYGSDDEEEEGEIHETPPDDLVLTSNSASSSAVVSSAIATLEVEEGELDDDNEEESDGEVEEEVENDEDDEEEDEEVSEEEFMRSLMALENADIDALQAIIAREEQLLGGN